MSDADHGSLLPSRSVSNDSYTEKKRTLATSDHYNKYSGVNRTHWDEGVLFSTWAVVEGMC